MFNLYPLNRKGFLLLNQIDLFFSLLLTSLPTAYMFIEPQPECAICLFTRVEIDYVGVLLIAILLVVSDFLAFN